VRDNLAGGSSNARQRPPDAAFDEGKSVKIRRGRAAVMDVCVSCAIGHWFEMSLNREGARGKVQSQKTGPQGLQRFLRFCEKRDSWFRPRDWDAPGI